MGKPLKIPKLLPLNCSDVDGNPNSLLLSKSSFFFSNRPAPEKNFHSEREVDRLWENLEKHDFEQKVEFQDSHEWGGEASLRKIGEEQA